MYLLNLCNFQGGKSFKVQRNISAAGLPLTFYLLSFPTPLLLPSTFNVQSRTKKFKWIFSFGFEIERFVEDGLIDKKKLYQKKIRLYNLFVLFSVTTGGENL